MPSPLVRHAIFLHNFGPTTSEVLPGTPPATSLSATGSGSWDTFPDEGQFVYSGALGLWPTFRQTAHQGRYNVNPGLFIFAVRATVTTLPNPDDVQFRLRDITNSVTIVTVSAQLTQLPFVRWPWHWGIIADLDDFPGGDAILEPQYTLVSPAVATYGGSLVGLGYGL
jgi:hypothetical protein